MKTRTALRLGSRPGGKAATARPELTPAARRLAESVIARLAAQGVTTGLDSSGRAHFRSLKVPPLVARRTIEIHGDLVEALLVERAIAAVKGVVR
jgi:hypothetical protein